MKQRVTYLLPAGTGIQSSDIQINDSGIDFLAADRASEEWQVKLELHELPNELRAILEGCSELRLRWSTPQPQKLLPPLLSRLPPGLHAFFAPREGTDDVPICSYLQRILAAKEAKCTSVYESFSETLAFSENPEWNPISQWHTYSSIDSQQLGNTVLGKVCSPGSSSEKWVLACDGLIQDLDYATHIDIDFDAHNSILIFTAHWTVYSPRRGHGGQQSVSSTQYRKARAEDRLEFGVLQIEAPKKPEEMTLGGYLVVVGDDKRPSPTYFSFPSRHHALPSSSAATFTTKFQHPTGLHPKLQLTLPAQHFQPPQKSCSLLAYLNLPSALFIDRFQLSDPLFLASQNLIALHRLAGAQDLEAPDWVTPLWGSASLLELVVPADAASATSGDWTVTIPLHLRYIDKPRKPTDARSEATVEVPWPVVFWACGVDDEVNLSNNPFDRVNLGYDGLFGPKTMFYHVPPAMNGSEMMIEEIKVPILNPDNAEMVQMGTLIAVCMGFAWVCWKLLGAAMPSPGQKSGKETKAQ